MADTFIKNNLSLVISFLVAVFTAGGIFAEFTAIQNELTLVHDRLDKKIIVIDPRYNNSNTKNIYISTDGNIDVDEGMLNYSHFSPNSSSKRRGNYYKNKHQPKEPETSSTNTFLNNMFKKIL